MGEAGTKKAGGKEGGGFWKGVKAEFRKIIWPERDNLVKESVAVIASTAILGLIISLLDMGIQYLIEALL